MATPTEDEFRALARSSPWLFRTVHFTRHHARLAAVEAWLSRPGRLLVVDAESGWHVSTGVPYSKQWVTLDGPVREWVVSPPQDHAPAWRPDGLVAERPDSADVDYDDPIWGSFDWVAMLDPVELSAGTKITDLTATVRRGRITWWAEIVAVDGYQPRCSCCSLLWGAQSERIEAAVGGQVDPSGQEHHFPESWLVGLDRRTGIVVSLEAIGGGHRDLGFTVDLHEVDAPMDESLFTP